MTLAAWPVAVEHRAPSNQLVGMERGAVSRRDDVAALRRAFKRKERRYGLPDAPLVLAIATSSSLIEPRNVTNAVFGSTAARWVEGERDSVRFVRLCDGIWKLHKNSPVSGVLFADHELCPHTPHASLPRLWLNPWMREPTGEIGPFDVTSAADTRGIIGSAGGACAREVLDLPTEWSKE